MRLLVTGGAGFVGSHTCIVLLQAGHDLVVVDDFSNSAPGVLAAVMEIAGRSLRSVEADIRDRAAMGAVFASGPFDAVLHFAALKSAPESIDKAVQYWSVNVGGMATLLEAAIAANVGKFVFSSSAVVYGHQEVVPTPETAPVGPVNPYAWTKLAGEQMLRDVVRSRPGFRACNLRYFNPIGNHPSGGIGENPKQRAANLFPMILSAFRERKPIRVFGTDYDTPDGSATRDYVHVMDVAEGHAAALKFLADGHDASEPAADAFNLGTGRASSVFDLVHAMERAVGVELDVVKDARRPGDVAVSLADPGLAARVLGWRARRTLDEACADAVRFLKRNDER